MPIHSDARIPSAAEVAKVAEMTRAGCTREAVAGKLHVTREMYRRWINSGDAGDERYVPLARAIHEAEADFEGELAAIVYGAARGGDWKAAAWCLERRQPMRWCLERMRVEPEGSEDAVPTTTGDPWVQSE